MWPRIVEIMLGCWLMISPFIFRLASDQTLLWYSDIATGIVVIAIALLACRADMRKMHFLNLLPSAYLIGVAFVAVPAPPPPAFQNLVVVGLLILIVAVIPTRGVLPPKSWQRFYQEHTEV